MDTDKDFEFLELQFTTLSGTATLESQRYRIAGVELINSDEEYKITLDKLINHPEYKNNISPPSEVMIYKS